MGLDILCGVSKKTYHAGYHALHMVRWLALVACGWPKKLGTGEYSGSMTTHFYVIPEGLRGNELSDMVIAAQCAGHLFPNLMLHSDCEGTYTRRGSVNLSTWQTGNSRGLLKELIKLDEMTPDELKGDSRAWEVYKMLREVVEDEVNNGKGYIKFC